MTDNQTTDPTTVGGECNRVQLRRTREKRVDHTHEIPFGERVEVECPDCGTETAVGIYGDHDVSYGNCWEWDCDTFHKFERDRAAEPTAEESSEVVQTTLVPDGGVVDPTVEQLGDVPVCTGCGLMSHVEMHNGICAECWMRANRRAGGGSLRIQAGSTFHDSVSCEGVQEADQWRYVRDEEVVYATAGDDDMQRCEQCSLIGAAP